jgi:DNA-directed RNA polymerase specialized sigma24 family protein
LIKREESSRPEHATREDVERAVESLSKADELRLETYAKYKVRGLGRKAMNRDYEDLLQEAFKSTWIGAEDPNEGRRWRKTEVSFVYHMLGAMRSIASHWKESFDDDAHLDSELAVETADGEILTPLENAPSSTPNQERTLIAKEELGAIFQMFQADDDAALIIEGMREEWTGPEIMEQLSIPKNRYEAALKRIRYHIR